MTERDNRAVPDAAPGGKRQSAAIPLSGFQHGPAFALTAIGVCCVMIGGLVAAVTGPLDLVRGSWLAAYLVLVGGLSQCAMGQARTWRPDAVRSPRWGWAQIAAWNFGSAVVIGGSLTSKPLAVDLGSVLLFIALAIALHAARPGSVSAAHRSGHLVPPLLDWAYRTLLFVLALSIAVGVVLSHLRNS